MQVEAILKNNLESVAMTTTTRNTDTKSKNQPVLLLPSLKYLAPFSKNTVTKSVSVISSAMLDCNEFEDEACMNVQIAGNIARLQMTITTRR